MVLTNVVNLCFEQGPLNEEVLFYIPFIPVQYGLNTKSVS